MDFRIELIDGLDDNTYQEDSDYLELDCSHIGTQMIRVWVIDDQGDVNHADVILVVQNNLFDCDAGPNNEIFPFLTLVTSVTTDFSGNNHIYIKATDFLPRNSPRTVRDSDYRIEFVDNIEDQTYTDDQERLSIHCDQIGTYTVRIWALEWDTYVDAILILTDNGTLCPNGGSDEEYFTSYTSLTGNIGNSTVVIPVSSYIISRYNAGSDMEFYSCID